jgi:ATP-dependent DNA helicase RecG
VGEELAAELDRDQPMHRLLQGEVGSGKTVVALRAMAQVVDAGGQAALLAPTEVLAAQHARGIRQLLGPLGRAGELDGDPSGTRVTLLTGSLKAAAKREARADVAEGRAGIVIGTHALLQEGVEFADLGLVVVDEQHRFGVEQRDALRAKGNRPPHVMVITATPITRTVAMTVYGDLEISTLRQLPSGRGGVSSSVVPQTEKPAWVDRAWQRVREEVAAGRQAYVVCPRIGEETGPDDEPEDADGAPAGADDRRPPLAVLDVAEMLRSGPLAGLRLDVLHGRLSPEEKDDRMRAFGAGEIDVLVATTVVEVGVDVPNATVMVVMDADRFGVSQLHQLRGRVARGKHAGLCLLVTDARTASPTGQRLAAVAATSDGFELARLDLETRREGDVLGAAQSGKRSGIRLLSLLEDEELIAAARAEATALLDTERGLADHPGLAAEVAALATDERAEWLEKA